MTKEITPDGFERENGEIVQSSMALGFLPDPTSTDADDGITTYTVPAGVTQVPGLTEQKVKFTEFFVESGTLYLCDQNGVANIADPKRGRKVAADNSVSYPLRGQAESPLYWWSPDGAVVTLTRGY